MASVCSRKRPYADDLSQDKPSSKRHKSAATGYRRHRYPPSFWDNLSKAWLTPLALQEIDRRTKVHHRRSTRTASAPTGVVSRDLARFARRGGPDLSHIRGSSLDVMESTSSSTPSRSRKTQSSKEGSAKPRSGKSSAYGKDFEQHLKDHDIHLNDWQSNPRNMEWIQSELAQDRTSLSPSDFTQDVFNRFRMLHKNLVFEHEATASMIPLICGNSDIPNKQNILFTELRPITNEDAVKLKPDFFDGAYLQDLSKELRNDQKLRLIIIPTKHPSVPVAPNFFLEIKGSDGNASVVMRQACFAAAYGARSMHALQNYGEAEPTYDGNAYAYSATYHAGAGVLALYANYVMAPNATGGRPQYHMTQIDSWGMTGNINTFRRGVTAFRNARDLAKRHRDAFIDAANARAALKMSVILEDAYEATPPLPADRSDYDAWQNADDALQQQIAESSDCLLRDGPMADAIPRYLYTEDNSQHPSQESAVLDNDDPSLSSFTSFDTEQLRSKRPRKSPSPPTGGKRTRPSQSGTRPGKAPQTSQSPAPTTPAPSSSSTESYWVEVYARKGNICFKNLQQQEVKTELKDWMTHSADGTQYFYWKSPKSGRVFWATELPREAKKGRS